MTGSVRAPKKLLSHDIARWLQEMVRPKSRLLSAQVCVVLGRAARSRWTTGPRVFACTWTRTAKFSLFRGSADLETDF